MQFKQFKQTKATKHLKVKIQIMCKRSEQKIFWTCCIQNCYIIFKISNISGKEFKPVNPPPF